MVMGRNREALPAGAEPFYGRQGGNFDDAPAGTGDFNDRYKLRPVDPAEEGTVHCGPGNQPVCGADIRPGPGAGMAGVPGSRLRIPGRPQS